MMKTMIGRTINIALLALASLSGTAQALEWPSEEPAAGANQRLDARERAKHGYGYVGSAELDRFRIDGEIVTNSFFLNTMITIGLRMYSSPAPAPPPQFDRPYPGPVKVVNDLPADGEAWGWTQMPKQVGAKCTIHTVPLWTTRKFSFGIELLDPIGMDTMLRHENGHCWRLVHEIDPDSEPNLATWKPAPAPAKQTKTSQPQQAAPHATPGNAWPPAGW